jgi:hypothetical protein
MTKTEMHHYLMGEMLDKEPNKLELNLKMLLDKSEFSRLIAENVTKQNADAPENLKQNKN